MSQQEWLDSVARHLTQSGLPKCYVDRTCCELADHAEQCASAGRRFSDLDESPDELCRTLVQNYRRRSLIGRLPLVLCLFVPVFLSLALPLAYFAGVGLAFDFFDERLLESQSLSEVERAVVWTFFYIGIVLVPVICSVSVGWFARQMARPWGWSLLMFGLLFWATHSVFTTLNFASDGPELSLALDLPRASVGSIYHWAQCLAVVIIGFYFVYQQKNAQHPTSA